LTPPDTAAATEFHDEIFEFHDEILINLTYIFQI
jgi:hypothetical protein